MAYHTEGNFVKQKMARRNDFGVY